MHATEDLNGFTFDFPQHGLMPRFPNEHQEIGLREENDMTLVFFFFLLQIFSAQGEH